MLSSKTRNVPTRPSEVSTAGRRRSIPREVNPVLKSIDFLAPRRRDITTASTSPKGWSCAGLTINGIHSGGTPRMVSWYLKRRVASPEST